jgi:oligopeptide/dipeptide ABC transporter ATP-binding protein
VVEYGSVHDVFANPLHPYTRGLFRSIPKLGETAHRLPTIPGNVANPSDLPTGCPFHPRCDTTRQCAAKADEMNTRVVTDAEGKPERVMAPCASDDPKLLEVTANHWVACHYAEGYEAGRATRPDVEYRRPVEQPA